MAGGKTREATCTIRTRKFMSNKLLSRRQFVSRILTMCWTWRSLDILLIRSLMWSIRFELRFRRRRFAKSWPKLTKHNQIWYLFLDSTHSSEAESRPASAWFMIRWTERRRLSPSTDWLETVWPQEKRQAGNSERKERTGWRRSVEQRRQKWELVAKRYVFSVFVCRQCPSIRMSLSSWQLFCYGFHSLLFPPHPTLCPSSRLSDQKVILVVTLTLDSDAPRFFFLSLVVMHFH